MFVLETILLRHFALYYLNIEYMTTNKKNLRTDIIHPRTSSENTILPFNVMMSLYMKTPLRTIKI